MQHVFELPVSFTFEQVLQFGELTGDNGPVHSVDGVVQGGFILSVLPKWVDTVVEQHNIRRLARAASVILESKFRNKLESGKNVIVSFELESLNGSLSKINWRIFDSEKEYCSGKRIIHKS